MVADALLAVGETIPGIALVCAAAKAILEGVARLHRKASDVLEILADNTDKVRDGDNNNAKELVERRMTELHDLLKAMKEQVDSFEDRGWMVASLLEVHKYELEEAMVAEVRRVVREQSLSEESAAIALAEDDEANAAVASKSAHVASDELAAELREHLSLVAEGVNDLQAKVGAVQSEMAHVRKGFEKKSRHARAHKMSVLEKHEIGLDSIGLDSIGLDSIGLDSIGLDSIGLDSIGLDSIGLDSIGLDSIGLDSIGLDSIGLDSIGLDSIGLDSIDPSPFVFHPGVWECFIAALWRAVTTDTNSLGLVMEYLPQGSLRNLLDDASTPITDMLTWAEEIAQGMAYIYDHGTEVRVTSFCAHPANPQHRDLKSNNILLTDDISCKISDFGLSRSAEFRTHATQESKGGAAGAAPFRWLPSTYTIEHRVFYDT
ncbi:hypothetical protein CTAYLR_008590 [Chrysophaeum taylorii]|uniref:Protein kinase domain-containing protein n=1 Tax=Chrysophaeum taylorii TaxID=2483200 RepID=A0AAD7ULM0_9STRA|nr:hypothetical protein CTAYLR_008590 [Chrysophaeum taylorii]